MDINLYIEKLRHIKHEEMFSAYEMAYELSVSYNTICKIFSNDENKIFANKIMRNIKKYVETYEEEHGRIDIKQ